MRRIAPCLASAFTLVLAAACADGTGPDSVGGTGAEVLPQTLQASGAPAAGAAVLLVIDEESIDNGNPPNGFSERDVNDDLARMGQRRVLRWFAANVGRELDLFTGQVGDEGWHALPRIPSSWRSAGPTDSGARNFVLGGPGLGGRDDDDLLDKVPSVTPLRATAQAMLVGQSVCAVVLDSDVSINYSPRYGSLKGETLGLVAFEVLAVRERRDGSTSDLPRVTIRVRDAEATCAGPLALATNLPAPRSSGEPFDIRPPASVAAVELVAAP